MFSIRHIVAGMLLFVTVDACAQDTTRITQMIGIGTGYGYTAMKAEIISPLKHSGSSVALQGYYRLDARRSRFYNRYSYSATEDFILSMKTFSTVAAIGDNTGGGSGSRPIQRELPNGWTYRVSSMLVTGPDKVPITAGIPPNIRVMITKTDSLNGIDPIIEMAKTTVTH